MFITYFRSSSYNGWEVCQMQYFLTYVLGLYSPSGKAAEKGTIVHKVMECLAQGKKAIQDGEDHFTDDSLGRYDIDEERLWDPEFFSRLCLDSWEHYTNPEKTTITNYTNRDWKEVVHWANQVPLQCNGAFDPRNRHVLEPEPFFDFEIEEPWAEYDFELPNGERLQGRLACKGTIDLVTLDTSGPYEVVETIDWKTGRRVNWANMQEKTFEKLCNDAQLSMYHYALSKYLYPQYDRFAMTINYVKPGQGGPYTMSYGPENHASTLEMLRKRFEAIKRAIRPRLRTGFFCDRVCHFGKTPHPNDGTRTMCKYLHDELRSKGLKQVMLEHTAPGFQLGYYQNPGS
jgi:hypothetical protein